MYYPALLHWSLRVIRELTHRVRAAVRAPGIERAEVFQMQRVHRDRELLAEEYAGGYKTGWRECFQTCLSEVEDEISRADHDWEVESFLPAAPKPPETEN